MEGYIDVSLRSSVHRSFPSVPVAVPTIRDVERVAADLCVFDPRLRRRAIGALPKVMTPGEYWSCGAPFRRGVPYFDGAKHPYEYCLEITRTPPLDDEGVLENVRRAAYLILVWYVDTISRGDAQRRSDLLETFFIIVKTNAPKKKRKCIETPSDAQQRARACVCSGELVAYVRAMGNCAGSEFDRIRTFLTSTEQGAALLAAAGIVDAFELDHYVPECLGGPSVVENAHIMPRNGDNQYFRDVWDMRKRRYCGEYQHASIRRILPGLVDTRSP